MVETEDSLKEVSIICPKCDTKKKLSVPVKIINQSKQLTTVSIPAKLCCEHSFQAFIDKNFKVRGYQQVDFDFSTIEYLDKDEEQEAHHVIPKLNDIIRVLRSVVDDQEILGSALFSIEGKIIYSSLPPDTLFNTIREFEVRKEENLIDTSRIYLVLENKQMVCSRFFNIHQKKYIMILIFTANVKLGMGNLILRQLEKEVMALIHE
ncbi:MAG: hypothetical protein ACFFBP_15610 [Promethearchaeota archaeon]